MESSDSLFRRVVGLIETALDEKGRNDVSESGGRARLVLSYAVKGARHERIIAHFLGNCEPRADRIFRNPNAPGAKTVPWFIEPITV